MFDHVAVQRARAQEHRLQAAVDGHDAGHGDGPARGQPHVPAQQEHGHTQLLATACKPYDCLSERILILYDENTHAMTGLFARRKSRAANDGDSNDPANDDLVWLGAPDEASKTMAAAQALFATVKAERALLMLGRGKPRRSFSAFG